MKAFKLPTDQVFLKQTERKLFLLLFLMVACFFTWSESVLVTRAIKVVGRMGVMLASIGVYSSILNQGAIKNLKWINKGSLVLYGLYLFLGLVSFSWSTNPGYSALQWFMTSQTLIFGFFFIRSINLLDLHFPGHGIRLYNLLGNTVLVLILIFLIGMWVNPDVFFRMTHGGEEARLGGVMMNPNELGMLCGVGVACLIFDLYRNHHRAWTIIKLLLLFYGLYLTGSRSSLIGALLIILFHISRSESKKLKVWSMALVLLVTPIAVNKIILKDGDSSRLEEVMSMTGRLPFWTALINEGLPREPLLGFGFMRIDYKEYFQSTHTYPGKMTHNTFLQVLMNLGFIGLTVVIFQMIFTFRGIARSHKMNRWLMISILIPIMINSFTEFGVFGESNYGILFYQLVLFSIAFSEKQLVTKKQRLHACIRAGQRKTAFHEMEK